MAHRSEAERLIVLTIRGSMELVERIMGEIFLHKYPIAWVTVYRGTRTVYFGLLEQWIEKVRYKQTCQTIHTTKTAVSPSHQTLTQPIACWT